MRRKLTAICFWVVAVGGSILAGAEEAKSVVSSSLISGLTGEKDQETLLRESLRDLGSDEVLRQLNEALWNDELTQDQRWMVAMTMAKVGGRQAGENLQKALHHRFFIVRMAAARGLG